MHASTKHPFQRGHDAAQLARTTDTEEAPMIRELQLLAIGAVFLFLAAIVVGIVH